MAVIFKIANGQLPLGPFEIFSLYRSLVPGRGLAAIFVFTVDYLF